MTRDSWREISAFGILAGAAFLLVSLLTYHPDDFYGTRSPVLNACGPVGFWVSHHLILWLGRWGSCDHLV